ncbi:hypothetical protein E8E13_008064 [Curvularia kusanoi]|uniref:Uncharacterized protein n=1 Tax=Curvularia kusanoi TaxID=90978 RepID=A0A9P4W526_CURKU|nr:hypothetical protein E8E13_008064 [Curvularia kusanoi]
MYIKSISAASFVTFTAVYAQGSVNCEPTGSGLFTAPRDAFSSFIDAFPSDTYVLDEGPYGFQRNADGNFLCADVRNTPCPDCGYEFAGTDVKEMLRQGFDECAANGGDRFNQYTVEDHAKIVRAGGGTCPGSFGVEGKYILV